MKQKGQGIIEFALIVPLLIAVGIAVVYVGIMFLDYTQYSNAASTAPAPPLLASTC
jgi:Flp pilus assembly protein TadG